MTYIKHIHSAMERLATAIHHVNNDRWEEAIDDINTAIFSLDLARKTIKRKQLMASGAEKKRGADKVGNRPHPGAEKGKE